MNKKIRRTFSAEFKQECAQHLICKEDKTSHGRAALEGMQTVCGASLISFQTLSTVDV